MTAHRILFGSTSQTLAHVPAGYVASATYTIENLRFDTDHASRVVASGSATVASWSLTSSASSGAATTNPRRFSTAATTGASIGDPAQLAAADGDAELVEVLAISSGSYVETSAPIAGMYPSGSTLRGIKITAPFPDAYAADEDELEREPLLRVVWSYTLHGRAWKVPELIEWSRQTPDVLDLGGAILSVRELYPDLAPRLPDGAQLERIASRLADDVRDDLRARGLDPAHVLLGPGGRSLMAAKIIEHASLLGYSPGASSLDSFRSAALKGYAARLANLVIGLGSKGPAAVDITDAPSGRVSSPISARM
jgi:hypothetical protein